jgi:hypothetical protein
MPITLTQPITIIVNDIGDTFVVETAKFDFTPLVGTFFWRIKGQGGKVLKQGTQSILGDDFKKFYNTEYKTHADLVTKVAELAGYSGVFKQDNLI